VRAVCTPSCSGGRCSQARCSGRSRFTRGRLPAIATLHDAFKRLDVPAFEAVLQEWATQALGRTERHLVLDGKALRGIHGDEVPGVRLVAYAPEAGLVLAQAGGQDPGGAGGNRGGQGAGEAESGVERRPASVGAGALGGTVGER
jgi:hypothetical protein